MRFTRVGSLLRTALAASVVAGPLAAQSTVAADFAPGGRQLVLLDFSTFPLGPLSMQDLQRVGMFNLKGELEVVMKDGVHMLRAAEPSTFRVRLPEFLPNDFTLEFDLIPKNCCAPQDLSFEGTAEIRQDEVSAHVFWHRDYLQVVGGVKNEGYDKPMPAALSAVLPGQLTNIAVSLQGRTLRMFTNGQAIYTLDRAFARGRVLRVFLGGQKAGRDDPVYLARMRIAAGPPSAVAAVPVNPGTTTGTITPAVPTATAVPAVTPTGTATPITTPTVTSPTATAPISASNRPASAAPSTSDALNGNLLVGVGMSDITGPISDVVMMGYANGDQKAAGLHTRLYARAYIFGNRTTNTRVVWVSAELGMMFSSVKQGVLRKLAARHGSLYTDENVMLSATHTHAGPGGYSHYTIYNISIGGLVRQNYDAIVDGITEAIEQAHNRLAPGSVSVMSHDLIDNTMVQRSKAAFMLNAEALAVPPVDEINRDMTLLKIHSGGRPIGAIAFHAVHNTSMPVTNRLVSSDHKGYAAYLLEKAYGSIAPFQRYGGFVAAFPNGAEGDMSPNLNTSAGTEFFGPDNDPFVSSQIIGTRQFNAAFGLFNATQAADIGSDVSYRHKFVVMPGTPVPSSNFTNGAGLKTVCAGAYGVSFMAGAEDGRTGTLSEGMALASTIDKTALDAARGLIVATVSAFMPLLGPVLAPLATGATTAIMVASSDQCQFPKPIILPTGFMHWSPEILPFQLIRIGSVAIAGIPGEMTMQAGRRLENAIRAVLLPLGVQKVLLTGLANEYSGYITTPEEYVSQQYEGASTLFGRLTFDAYREAFQDLGVAMASGKPATGAPPPADLSAAQIEWKPAVDHDELPIGESFGQFLLQPAPVVSRGTPVRVIYRSGNPRNDLRRNDTYVRIERDSGGGNWVLAAWDGTPDTRLYWSRSHAPIVTQNGLIGKACPGDPCSWSTMDLIWFVPPDATPGLYRIRAFGSWKNGVTSVITPYERTTLSFTVR